MRARARMRREAHMEKTKITIIGGGLAGCTMAIYLAKLGYHVELFDRRSDLRRLDKDFGRSINLALMHRGMHTFTEIGIADRVKAICVPMRARAIHQQNGEITLQAFGRHPDEYINAVSRAELTRILLDTLSEYSNVSLHFDQQLMAIDFATNQLTFKNSETDQLIIHRAERVIAADGVSSAVRKAMQEKNYVNFSQQWLPHSYKELIIPKQFGHYYEQETLLSWPRESFMLLGNPNHDGSWTCTLFMANEGEKSFAQLQTAEAINTFFAEYFPDVQAHMPTLIEDFLQHPLGTLSTVKGSPWYYQDKYLLIGDAAHGIVPFFGQGMNSALEDCKILNDCIMANRDDWQTIFEKFYQSRKPNADAVAELSFDNYLEIRDRVMDPKFHLRKQIEWKMMQRYGEDYLAKHVMIMFYRYPYAVAQACGRLQDQLFNQLLPKINCIDDVMWQEIDAWMETYKNNCSP